MQQPTTKLYFVKKPTMSSGDFGREPRIGEMRTVTVKGRPRKIKEAPADEEIITREDKLNKLMAGERARRKAQIGSQKKLDALSKRARKRAEKLSKPVELLPFEEEARKKLLAKTFAAQAEAKRKEEEQKKKDDEEKAKVEAQRQAILSIPQLLGRQQASIQSLQTPLQQNLMALQRVAPEVADELRKTLLPEKEGDVMRDLFREPEVKEPTESEAMKSRAEVAAREIVRKVVEDEGVTSKQKVAARVKELLGTDRMPKGVNDMISEKLGKKPKGKGLSFQETTTPGVGRKGISGGALTATQVTNHINTNWTHPDPVEIQNMITHLWDMGVNTSSEIDNILSNRQGWTPNPHRAMYKGGGFFSSIKNLAKSAASKIVDVVKEDPVGAAKKAFEVAKQAKEQYHNLTGKGGKLPIRHQRMFMKELEKHKGTVGGSLFGELVHGFTGALTAPLGYMMHKQVYGSEGGGFFSSLKDLGKKAINKVMEDPIGSAKQAISLGQQAREQYAKMTGKSEKGGKMFIPKKHQKIFYSHAKKAHGKGFADMFLKGLITPFSVVSKIAQAVPVLGDAVGKVGMALPNVVTSLTGVKPLI